MPLFDVECDCCGETFEYLQIRSDDFPVCPKCNSSSVKKIFSMMPNIRMDSDQILKSMPDPQPPLEELRGKQKPGTEGGFADKPYASTHIKDWTYTKDKYGNKIWKEKRRQHFDMGKNL